MGALVGYLICQKIEELSIRKPLKIIFSGRIAPSTKVIKKVSDFSKDNFWKEVFDLGGIPDSIKNNLVLQDFFEPILRADFNIVENYMHTKKNLLSVLIDVLYGKYSGLIIKSLILAI